MEYLISKTASQDLHEILDYFLARDLVNVGERFIREFNQKSQNIVSISEHREKLRQVWQKSERDTLRWIHYFLSSFSRQCCNCARSQWLSGSKLHIWKYEQ